MKFSFSWLLNWRQLHPHSWLTTLQWAGETASLWASQQQVWIMVERLIAFTISSKDEGPSRIPFQVNNQRLCWHRQSLMLYIFRNSTNIISLQDWRTIPVFQILGCWCLDQWPENIHICWTEVAKMAKFFL